MSLPMQSAFAGPPSPMRQNETPYWDDVAYTDRFGQVYDSANYTLTYVFAGASAAPVSITATANGLGWRTAFDSAKAAQMLPGLYWWQAVLTAPGVRLVPAEGELVVEKDLAAVTGTFDGRTVYENGLAACETALATFSQSGGRIKSYEIAGRRMEFADTSEIKELADWFRARIEAEKMERSGGDRRYIRIGFGPPTSGVPTSQSKNWPWW